MKKISLLVCLVIGTYLANAQTVVIEETVQKDTTQVQKKKSISLGFMLDFTFYGGADEKGLKGTLANSGGVNALLNAKWPLRKGIMMVFQTGFNFENYAYQRSDTNNVFPTPLNNDIDVFMLSAYSLSAGARFKVYKSFYTELGAMGKWNFSNAINYQTKDANKNHVEVFVRDLNYVSDFNADAYLRLGYKFINFVAYYRLNDVFKANSIAPVVYELPRLRLGISLGI
jgi:hypothetical protein